MLGFNGGLMGVRRTPTVGAASGLWFQNEQSVAKRAGIWPIAGGDPYWANVSLLLHMDGSNGSTTFTDSSSNALAITANGNAQISTAQSKFGGASGYFDGSGDSLSTSSTSGFAFGSADFTVEFWMYPTSTSSTSFLPGLHFSNDGAWIVYRNGTTIQFYARTSSTGAWDIANGITIGTVAVNTWYHVAVSRSGNTVYTFLDGVAGTTASSSAALATTSSALQIGANAGGDYYTGYLDELRITKGTGRYNANFTPPTAAFPNG
jgi:hypothetical protein